MEHSGDKSLPSWRVRQKQHVNRCSYDRWQREAVHGAMRACNGDKWLHLFKTVRQVSQRERHSVLGVRQGHSGHGELPSAFKDPVVGTGRAPGTEKNWCGWWGWGGLEGRGTDLGGDRAQTEAF